MLVHFIVWGLSGIWLIFILILWWAAYRQAIHLSHHKKALFRSYRAKQGQPFTEPQDYLESMGWDSAPSLSRQDIIAHWRAMTQTDRQHLSGYIEMMPQMGLLGTVVSLFLSASLFDFTTKMLGLALLTTMFGLLGALFARRFLEMPADRDYHNILELLQNEEVVARLINTGSQEDMASVGDEEPGGQSQSSRPFSKTPLLGKQKK